MNKKLKLEELNRLDVEAFKSVRKNPIVVVLDNIRSAYNIGSVFRTSDALAIEEVVLCGITAQPPHREIMKTALGASESVNWKYYSDTVNAVQELKNQGYQLLALEQVENSKMLNNFNPKENLEDFKEKTYEEVKKIHIQRFPYNDFLYYEYKEEDK